MGSASYGAISASEHRILSEIDSARLMHTIERMCADDFAGRRAGSPEQNRAIDYLTHQFKADGLVGVTGLSGYRQPLTMRYSLINDKENIKATLGLYSGGQVRGGARSKVFPYSEYNGHGGLDLHSRVVFVGYGICDPAWKDR